MGTDSFSDPVAAALFPKVRRHVLSLLLGHADRAFYMREIVQRTGLGVGHVQRELQRLSGAGILSRTEVGRHVFFQANAACPVFQELRALVAKAMGVVDRLREALQPLAVRIVVAFIYGSLARGEEREGSDVDLMVIGDVSLPEVVASIRAPEVAIGREVTPTVYSAAEAVAKSSGHFLSSVLRGQKLFVVGDEDELARLLAQRVDPLARDLEG